jgi:hypothetical protein
MTKTLIIDVIKQQLSSLSIEELLEVRTKVDALIQAKSYSLYTKQLGFNPAAIYYVGNIEPIQTDSIGFFKTELVSSPNKDNDESLEKLIKLVDEWMADESDYDQQTYPQIEAALNQNKLSF